MRSLTRQALACAVALCVLAVPVPVQAARAHPLHTTLTQITRSADGRTVVVTIRAFADDFLTAVAQHARVPRATIDPAVSPTVPAYLGAAFELVAANGQRIPLRWAGVRRQGDLLWLTLDAPAPAGLHGMRVRSRVLFELFEDQINIVQATYDGRHESMLFTRSDGPKALP